MFNLSFINILLLVSAASVFFIGLFILSKNKKSGVNFTFFLHAIVIALWLFGTFMMFISRDNREASIFWDRFIYGAVVFIPAFMYHFGLAYSKKKPDSLLYLGYILSFIFLALTPTKYFVDDLFIYQWGVHTKARFFHHIFLIYFISFVIIWFIKMFYHFKSLRVSILREQTKYVFMAFLVLFTIGPLAYLPAYGIGIYPFSYISGLIFTFILFYAIIAHRLMDIKIALRRSSVFLASVSLVLIMAAAIKYIFDNLLSGYSVLGRPLILITAVFVFPPLKNQFYGLANKYFFSSLYDSGEVIAALSERLRSTLTAEKIYEYIYGALAGAFHAKAFNILIYNEKTKRYTAQYNNDFNLDSKKGLPEDKVLARMFIKKNQPIITEDADSMDELRGNKTIALLKKTGIEILAPLNVKDKTIGLIALGKKESGDMYNDDDLKVLETTGAQAAIALENALLYKESKNFGVKLEKEVERATRDLRQANEQLKKLDAAKSEFISIASHQLRTPLTVIKGYISMMLDGNFGVLTGPEKESLEKVFSSNERLIQLVENLLDVSRIESGQFEFSFKQTDLNKLVADAADKLAGEAKEKNLILEYKPPAKPLPLLKLDQEKIKQVILNLIDNGIRYTKQGSVIITLELLKNKVKFCVSDSGMGIAPEDMINMFKKFSRGSGTSLVYTEGVGLNLYVARITIEAHQGKIWAESEGKGSKFCFELPAGQEDIYCYCK